jgi:hypothetical protein
MKHISKKFAIVFLGVAAVGGFMFPNFSLAQGSIFYAITGTTGGGGSYGGSSNSVAGAPAVQTNTANVFQNSVTLNGSANPNGLDTLAWFEYGTSPSFTLAANAVSLGNGNSYNSFSQYLGNLLPNIVYYYRAVARNVIGISYGPMSSFMTSGSGSGLGLAAGVVTKAATIISQNSAFLNGDVNSQNGVTSAWFEYGQTIALGSTTAQLPIGTGSAYQPYSLLVSGLSANTIYYFRAAAQNQYGASYGSILSFITQASSANLTPAPAPTPTPAPAPIKQVVVTQVVNSTAAVSCVALVPTINANGFSAGKEFVFTVVYRNNCNFSLQNSSLRVILPAEIDFKDTSNPKFIAEGNTIVFNLGKISPNVEAAINIRGKVRDSTKKGDNLTFTAILSFTDEAGRTGSVAAYLTAVVTSGPALMLMAFLVGALKGLAASWFFWLLPILILIILIYFIFFRKRGGKEQIDLSGLRVSAESK